MGRMDEWREDLKRRVAVQRLPLEEKRRRMFRSLDPEARVTPEVLEHGVVMVEAFTADGAFDLAMMKPETRKVFEVMIRRMAAGPRPRDIPSIIDSSDPGNEDPLGLWPPTVYPPETTKNDR